MLPSMHIQTMQQECIWHYGHSFLAYIQDWSHHSHSMLYIYSYITACIWIAAQLGLEHLTRDRQLHRHAPHMCTLYGTGEMHVTAWRCNSMVSARAEHLSMKFDVQEGLSRPAVS